MSSLKTLTPVFPFYSFIEVEVSQANPLGVSDLDLLEVDWVIFDNGSDNNDLAALYRCFYRDFIGKAK